MYLTSSSYSQKNSCPLTQTSCLGDKKKMMTNKKRFTNVNPTKISTFYLESITMMKY